MGGVPKVNASRYEMRMQNPAAGDHSPKAYVPQIETGTRPAAGNLRGPISKPNTKPENEQ
jgi:hypothetical protein